MGKCFDAYKYLGAHFQNGVTTFRVFAPNAMKISVIGDFNEWQETPLERVYDDNFYECAINNTRLGMRYKYRIYGKDGTVLDRADPYGFGSEMRPNNCSIIRDLNAYRFTDGNWRKRKKSFYNRPINIYEVHLGSWKKPKDSKEFYTYSEIGDLLIPYLKQSGYNYIEIMPICEYPNDSSWGYQGYGYYCPTSRYGDMNSLKKFINDCHTNNIGVILDFVPAHFAIDDYGLSYFDGSALYENAHKDIALNEWGSKNFNFSRGEVRSYLQSSACYWLDEYHFDGIRFDAIRNVIYWQGDEKRGENGCGINFLKVMNRELKERFQNAMLCAEDSTAFPKVTTPVKDGGLGFDFKWDMGWMNDTLAYFQSTHNERKNIYNKLTFSMHYFYNERFLLPLSHDEVVHCKGTILQKMNGETADKFKQAKALYAYMFTHCGKKLNFMGNEIAQIREWSEQRAQDWELLDDSMHNAFYAFIVELNKLYLNNSALYEKDYERAGFEWLDCSGKIAGVYAYLRKSTNQTIAAIFNFSGVSVNYSPKIKNGQKLNLLLDTNWERYGGNIKETDLSYSKNSDMVLEPFSAKIFNVI
ncbi:MAG: 1,4-alpha-glucan branching protein GlgB [Roseburia sp.]|nr:1,4-alpha-glucan branching protein GlgB [Roseburia sp.]